MSEQKRYTTQEMREQAIRREHNYDDAFATAAMLRQAADDAERLEAVVKECESINDATFERSINKVVAYKTRVDVASDAICHRILRAARGEGGAA